MLIVAVALLPVIVFLLVLVLADSFKLVPFSTLSWALAGGAAAALVATALHAWLFRVTSFSPESFSRYVAPVTEESLKALVLIYFLKKHRIGFLVDAAIVGFAVGAGFAMIENIDYLRFLPSRSIWVWLVRGFGTAILHATTTAVIAIAAKALMDRYPNRGLAVLVPGAIVAVLLHSAYNHALVSPLLATAMMMVVLPLVVMTVFSRSEKPSMDSPGSAR